ncbi:DUF4190 domain-containing protein [Micromonospora olivasterospora]|uniref:DUF4190 domain-containing protein n=1 Tax=Micromonospora olivasterospora TaxID=1880 RepID=A0A562I6P1_MICOL|nr:DUF4190 domain-containing protein [Micromonospora olivasterospora]TWH66496.1 hypothetical protein JD77_01450 [Micromonospora olivasterospora]
MNTPYPPPPPPPAAAGRDRTTLWGVLGIVLGLLCCGILGIIFGYLSIRDARRYGKSPVLGYLAIAFGVINIIAGAILRSTGNHPFYR